MLTLRAAMVGRPPWCWLGCVGPESPSDRGHVIATIAAAVSMHPTLAKLDAMQIGAIELQNTRRAFRRLDTYLVLTRIVVADGLEEQPHLLTLAKKNGSWHGDEYVFPVCCCALGNKLMPMTNKL